jgi:5-methylcytosine-specific restriction endonuclease McrA
VDTAVLLLSQSYQPIGKIHWQRAITWLVTGRVEILESYEGQVIRSASQVFPMPSVVRFLRKVHGLVFRKGVKFSRRNVWLRDTGTCFGAGTLVLMADGSQHPIETIKVGDVVIDAYGEPQRVTATGNRTAYDGLRLKHRGSAISTVITADHPVLTTSGEFVPISCNPEYLVFPRNVSYIKQNKPFDTVGFLSHGHTIVARDGRAGYFKSRLDVGVPTSITPSSDLAYFLGLFCAEGSATQTKSGYERASFAFHEKETETLVSDVSRIAEKCLGIKSKLIRGAGKGVILRLRGTAFSKILATFVGSKENKKIPWNLIGPYYAEFLRGLFLGDGHIDYDRHRVVLSLIAPDLIFGAQSMLWGFGIYPTLQVIEERGNHKRVLSLVLSAQNYTRFQKEILGVKDFDYDGEVIYGDSNFVFRKIQSLEPIETPIQVFNLETSGSHTYIANGLAVHNCQYCGIKVSVDEFTFDHVIPRKLNGKTSWENIVTCCIPCNQKKADRTLREAKMKLSKDPVQPKNLPSGDPSLFCGGDIPETWKDYLSSFSYWYGALG